MPGDGYYNDRQGFNPNRRGQIFETGTDRYYRDRENGYAPSSRKYEYGTDKIQFDKVKIENGRISTIEDKSGRIAGSKDVKQLEVVYELIKKGEIDHHTLRSVEHEIISDRCQELINKIRTEFPDKFTHLQVSRDEARTVWTLGLEEERRKQLEKDGKGVQLELPGVAQKAREQKGVDLQKRRDKQVTLAKARDRKERARERLANIRRIVQAREEQDRARLAGEQTASRVALEFPTPEHLRRIEAPTTDRATVRETPEAQRIRAERAAAEKAVREFQDRLRDGTGPSATATPEKATPDRETPEAARARVEQEAREQVLREFPFPAPVQSQESRTVEIGERSTPELNQAASVEREAAAERAEADKAREAAAQQREAEAREAERRQAELDQARDAAYHEMLNQPQVPEHIRLGLSHAHAPDAAVRNPPGQAPSVQRVEKGRDGRGIERTR
ncbi:hypothetical protein [Nocardia colli]|uniref:hypothetical protein n=1 Tax=Nocardia colli TaxID=2545717 RepID=UPI0035E1DBC6